MVKGSLGGQVYAFSEMSGHMSMLRDFYGQFLACYPGMVGFEICESLFTHIKNAKVIPGRFPPRHFLAEQQATGLKGYDNAYWLPVLGNPAGSLAEKRSDLVPLLRLLESGTYPPGTLRPLRGAAFSE